MNIVNARTRRQPDRTVIMGVIGVGKSTWASNADRPLYMDIEDRLSHVTDKAGNPVKIGGERVTSWDGALNFIREFPINDFKTCVIDTIDEMEALAHKKLCAEFKVPSITEVGGGYGKGFDKTVELFRAFNLECDKLRAKGAEIIYVAHSQVKTFNNPSGPDYARFIPRMNEKLALMICSWADNVFFCCHKDDLIVKKGENQGVFAKAKAVGNDDSRVMKCQRTPAWEAKNHYELPEEIPLDYGVFAKLRAEWIAKNSGGATTVTKTETKAEPKKKEATPDFLSLGQEAFKEYMILTKSDLTKVRSSFLGGRPSKEALKTEEDAKKVFLSMSAEYKKIGIEGAKVPALCAALDYVEIPF